MCCSVYHSFPWFIFWSSNIPGAQPVAWPLLKIFPGSVPGAIYDRRPWYWTSSPSCCIHHSASIYSPTTQALDQIRCFIICVCRMLQFRDFRLLFLPGAFRICWPIRQCCWSTNELIIQLETRKSASLRLHWLLRSSLGFVWFQRSSLGFDWLSSKRGLSWVLSNVTPLLNICIKA